MILKPLEILLVEDNPGDVRLMMEALTEGEAFNIFSVVSNGKDAMDFLRKSGKYEDALRPDIILLDLNLPKKDGREVLQEVKSDPLLKKIPIIVLTTSQEEQDIARSYEKQANCYITKPVDFGQFKKVVQSLETFWFNNVQLPQRGEVRWK